MARLSPVLPLVGAETLFQPAYVDDVAQAIEIAANGECASGIYQLGGPERLSFRDLMVRMLAIVGRRRLIVDLPLLLARPMAGMLDILQFASGGAFVNSLLTADQVRQLQRDNLVADDALGFADLGIEPTAMDTVLTSYLKRFRPPGPAPEDRDVTS